MKYTVDADELEWYVPAAILPTDLQSSLNIIHQYLETPFDLQGKKASQLLSKKRRRRARRRAAARDAESDAEDEEQPKRKERKKKEETKYKSAQFIEDSDAELGDDEEFFAKEAALRERAALAATQGLNATMKPAGTKKRKKHKEGEGRGKKRGKTSLVDNPSQPDPIAPQDPLDSDVSESSVSVEVNHFTTGDRSTPATSPEEAPRPQRPKPRPKVRPSTSSRATTASPPPESHTSSALGSESRSVDDEKEELERAIEKPKPRPRPRPTFKPSSPEAQKEFSDPEEDRSPQLTNRKRKKAALFLSESEED